MPRVPRVLFALASLRCATILSVTLGVYIQVPFCQTKCTYCNFHTGVVSRDRYQPYANAVCREIAQFAGAGASVGDVSAADATAPGSLAVHGPIVDVPSVNDPIINKLTIDTIYFGGGTPSLLDPTALTAILAALRGRFRTAFREVTLEADPETIQPEKAEAWLAAGFTRISLGAQSFHDRELQPAGRMHRRADIFHAVRALSAAGFQNISLDLIAGLAYQTAESWSASLRELLEIRPQHVSIYMLEIDEGSRLGQESLAGGSRYGAAAIPPEESMAEFYELASAALAAAGYEHYEISNWGLPGFRSLHNSKYWRREPYLGFGAGAHSFDGCTRWANVHDSARYVAGIEQGLSPREQIETVTSEQALEEEFFLGLRQLEGIDFARIRRDYHGALPERVSNLSAHVDRLCALGLVELHGSRLRLAPARLSVSNEVLVELLA